MSVLSIENLSKSFSGIHAVRDVSIDVPDEQFLGIIGPNGAGKTNLFSLLAGEQPPTSGRVRTACLNRFTVELGRLSMSESTNFRRDESLFCPRFFR